ncbi:MAG: acyl-CoA dehydrogenase family protein [Pseudomonadota bacterium]
MTYTAPIHDMRHALDHVVGLDDLVETGAFEDLTSDLVDSILEEASKFASGVFAPLNAIGDRHGAQLENGVVRLPDGFQDGYGQFVEAGWNCVSGAAEHGGMGLPYSVQMAVQEMMTSANMAFSLCPMLTQGAIEALSAHGTAEQKRLYLPKLISGDWSGTMNLTEPQAGSDVGALSSKAEPQGGGTYHIKGQKIYITWGEHECSNNIIHLVLARLPGAPAGTRGISLFLVPKFMVNDDGSLGQRNDLRCVSLERKMGIHASPTCTMSFGDNDACVGYLIGEENRGMACMFTMMNNARIAVGLQGVAIAERAYQHALSYARERVQSARFHDGPKGPAKIIEHADVRRMLMTMKANVEACRAIVYMTAGAVDRSHHHGDESVRAASKGLADLLTPVAKGYSTDMGVEMSSLAIQVFGGMGYVEESGAAQHLRDSRIAPIYEGTNGIQALDLVGRKLTMDGGKHWKELFAQMRDFTAELSANQQLEKLQPYLEDGIEALQAAAVNLFGNEDYSVDTAAGASQFLRMFGIVLGGYLLAKQAKAAQSALAAGEGNPDYLNAKLTIAQFYAEQIMPEGTTLLGPVTAGGQHLFALQEDQFAL